MARSINCERSQGQLCRGLGSIGRVLGNPSCSVATCYRECKRHYSRTLLCELFKVVSKPVFEESADIFSAGKAGLFAQRGQGIVGLFRPSSNAVSRKKVEAQRIGFETASKLIR